MDRKKDMIIRGGYNVYPREIEEVLYEHPAVLEAAVIGIPHPSLGEEVGAAVTLKPGGPHPAGTARVRAGQGRGVQVPAARVAGGRAAEGPHRQDPAPRGPASGRRQLTAPPEPTGPPEPKGRSEGGPGRWVGPRRREDDISQDAADAAGGWRSCC